MQIKEIMTKEVITVQCDTDITQVAKILRQNKIHGIPVLDGEKLAGIITETDFFIKGESEMYLPSYIDFLTKSGLALAEGEIISEDFERILKAKARDIMTRQCVTLSGEADVKDFLQLIREKNLHTIPVTIGDELKGVVTVSDVIKLI